MILTTEEKGFIKRNHREISSILGKRIEELKNAAIISTDINETENIKVLTRQLIEFKTIVEKSIETKENPTGI